MKKQNSQISEIKLIGLKVRTNNKVEANQMEGKIFPCVQRYFHEKLFETIPSRKNPGTTFCAYTEYESDHNGDYTYFIGEEVSDFEELPRGFETLVIPPQNYVKFTTEPAPMPDVIVGAWQKIWNMSPEELGGQRNYQTDFEIYDERAADHSNIVMDVYIGIS